MPAKVGSRLHDNYGWYQLPLQVAKCAVGHRMNGTICFNCTVVCSLDGLLASARWKKLKVRTVVFRNLFGIIERDVHKELHRREGESVVGESAGIAMSAWLKFGTLEACCKIVQVLHSNAMKK